MLRIFTSLKSPSTSDGFEPENLGSGGDHLTPIPPRRQEIVVNTRNWVDFAQDRDYWRALVNAALNLQVPYAMELVS